MDELSNFLSNKRKGNNQEPTHIVYDSNSSLRGSYNIESPEIPKLFDIVENIRGTGLNVSSVRKIR